MVHFRKFNPYKHHRRSIRLQNWDYSSSGVYFITMRVKWNSVCLGEIVSGKVRLNDYGKIVADIWLDLPNHYENIELGEWTVMPDHFHGIIIIKERITVELNKVRTSLQKATTDPDRINYRNKRRKMLLSKIIGRFKMVSAKQINLKLRSSGKLWQRDYFEHLVKEKNILARIENYIRNNPSAVKNDCLINKKTKKL